MSISDAKLQKYFIICKNLEKSYVSFRYFYYLKLSTYN